MRACRATALITCGVLGVAARNGSLIQQAPPEMTGRINPYQGSTAAFQAGRKLYLRECAACHGRHGKGIGKAPALVGTDVAHASPGALFWVLRNGSLYRGMPSFAHLPEPQRWQIIDYVLWLSNDGRRQ